MPQAQYQFLLDLVNTRFESDLIARGLAAQDQPAVYDITNKVMEASVRRGRDNELDPFGPGTMTLLLDNTDWRFTPDHGGSPLYGYLRPGAMVTARVPVPDYAGLVSWWTLDESSASTRYDSYGTNHLTPATVGTVTQAEGIVGNAAAFDGATWLRCASNSTLQVGDIDFSVCAWVYLDSDTRGVIAAKNNGAGNFQWQFGYNAIQRFYLIVSNDGTTQTTVSADTFGAPALNTWYFVMAFHDAANNVIGISVNNGTIDTLSYSSGVYASGNGDLTIGSEQAGSTLWNGRIDSVSFWKRVLPSVTVANVIVTLILDQFTDTNGTSIASHTIAPTNTPATSWTIFNSGASAGTWAIQSNQVAPSGFPSAGTRIGGQCDSGVADCTVSADMTTSASAFTYAGICVRYTDANNHWRIVAENSVWLIIECNAGTETTRASTAKTINTSTTYALQAVLSGNTITATVDGGSSISYASASFQNTATKHGITEKFQSGFMQHQIWDNFQVTA